MFYRLEDASMRINKSVVHYKNMPVFIQRVYNRDDERDGEILVDFTELLSQKVREGIVIEKDTFNCKAFEIGYVNSDLIGAIYIERVAVRRVKEGLSGYNVMLREEDEHVFRGGGLPEDLLTSKNLGDTIINNYPSLQRALRDVRANPNAHTVAFNRAFAFRKGVLGIVYLMHKGTNIGWVNEDTGKIRLGDNNMYMKEELTFKGIDNYGT